jgi:hypothetical protein
MRDERTRARSGATVDDRRRGERGALADGAGPVETGPRAPVGRHRDTTADGAPLVAGYRLIRLVGRGRSSVVHLARAERATDPDAATNVAVKIVPPTERSRGEAEIVALQSVVSEHVVALRDVAALLAHRGSLTPGETVTLVVSVLRGLGDLHEAGLVHGALDLTHVLIDATGRPLLGGLGSSRPLSGGGALADAGDGDPVEQDLTRVSRMVRALRDPVDARGAVSDAGWDTWLELLDSMIHGESALTAHDLAERLLDVADAAPLADAGGRPDIDGVDVRLADTASTADIRRRAGRSRPRERDEARTPRIDAHRHRAARESPARRASLRLVGLRGVMRRELGAVRPRVWVLGATALLLLAIGAVGLPLLTDAAHGEAAEPTAEPTTTGSPSGAASEQVPTAAPSAIPDTTDADSAAAASPDPDVAAPALLRLRAACLRRADLACVSTVDEAGSAIEDADRTTVSAGGGDHSGDGSLHVTDLRGPARRMGDGALVELRPDPAEGEEATGGPGRRPASLLIVRGEAGWRIRDLMDDR